MARPREDPSPRSVRGRHGEAPQFVGVDRRCVCSCSVRPGGQLVVRWIQRPCIVLESGCLLQRPGISRSTQADLPEGRRRSERIDVCFGAVAIPGEWALCRHEPRRGRGNRRFARWERRLGRGRPHPVRRSGRQLGSQRSGRFDGRLRRERRVGRSGGNGWKQLHAQWSRLRVSVGLLLEHLQRRRLCLVFFGLPAVRIAEPVLRRADLLGGNLRAELWRNRRQLHVELQLLRSRAMLEQRCVWCLPGKRLLLRLFHGLLQRRDLLVWRLWRARRLRRVGWFGRVRRFGRLRGRFELRIHVRRPCL